MTRRGLLIALVIVGLIARLAVAVKSGLNEAPPPGSDAREIDTYAWNVAQGRGYRGMSPDVTDQNHLTAYRPPGASLLWAALYKVVGHRYDAVRIVHCLLSAATIIMVYAIGRRCFNESVALLAAAIWTVWPSALFYSGELLAEAPATFCLLCCLLVCLQFAERPNARRAIFAGVLLGLTLITRPSTVIFIPLVGVWALWQFRHQWRAALLALTIPTLGVLTLVPWAVRNYHVFGKFIPISTMGGSVLLQGNNDIVATNPVYYGFSVWDTKINDDITRQLKAPNNEYERDQVAGRIAVEWLKTHRDKWWYLIQARFRRSWTPLLQQPSRVKRALYLATWGPILVLFAVSFFPTLINFLRQGDGAWIIHLAIAHYALNSVMFYVVIRYRFPIEGLCIILACVTVIWLWNALSKRRRNTEFEEASVAITGKTR